MKSVLRKRKVCSQVTALYTAVVSALCSLYVTIFDNTDVISLIFMITTPRFPKEIYILSET